MYMCSTLCMYAYASRRRQQRNARCAVVYVYAFVCAQNSHRIWCSVHAFLYLPDIENIHTQRAPSLPVVVPVRCLVACRVVVVCAQPVQSRYFFITKTPKTQTHFSEWLCSYCCPSNSVFDAFALGAFGDQTPDTSSSISIPSLKYRSENVVRENIISARRRRGLAALIIINSVRTRPASTRCRRLRLLLFQPHRQSNRRRVESPKWGAAVVIK